MKCKNFEVYLTLTYDKCMRICNQNPHQDTQHSSQHRKSFLPLSQSQSLPIGNQYSDIFHFLLVSPLLEFIQIVIYIMNSLLKTTFNAYFLDLSILLHVLVIHFFLLLLNEYTAVYLINM